LNWGRGRGLEPRNWIERAHFGAYRA
jgi:hypothetical protein